MSQRLQLMTFLPVDKWAGINRYFFVAMVLFLMAGNGWAIRCPGCNSSQMEFSNDHWHCSCCGADSGVDVLIPKAINAQPVVSESGVVTPWGSAMQVKRKLDSPRSRVLPESSVPILSCRQISEIISMLQGWYGRQLDFPTHSVHNALVLAQLQLLQLIHQEKLDISYEQQQLNLSLLVAYWLLQGKGHPSTCESFLQQAQLEHTAFFNQIYLLSPVLMFPRTCPELISLFSDRATRRDSKSQALTRLREMEAGSYGVYHFGDGQVIIIYFIDDAYYIITPFNRVVRAPWPLDVVRILVDLMQYQTPWQWGANFIARISLAFMVGSIVGSFVGIPMAIFGRLLGGLSRDDMANVLSIYSLAGGAAAMVLRESLYEPKPEPDIDDDLD